MERRNNTPMKLRGHVHQGVVVLDDGATLPEGTEVTISCDKVRVWRKPGEKKRVEFPLIHSNHPGTLHLTGERIAEILDQEDASPRD